jgi:hypothetical protein
MPVFGPQALVAGPSLLPSPVGAFWKLEGTSGLGLYDASLNGNNLTTSGIITQVSGIVGDGIAIGSGGGLQAAYAAGSFSTAGNVPFGFAAWVNLNGTNPHTESPVLGNENGTNGDADYVLEMGFAAPYGTPTFLITNSNYNTTYTFVYAGYPSATGIPISFNKWHLIVCWYDGNFINLQVDNGIIYSAPWNLGTGANTTPITMGALWEGGTSFVNQLAGALDEVIFWRNVVPRTDQLNALWNEGAGL